jgi:hypothetical protein
VYARLRFSVSEARDEDEDEGSGLWHRGIGSSALIPELLGVFNVWLRFLKRRRGVSWVRDPDAMIVKGFSSLHMSCV